jgi:hypothetical protein
MSEVSTISLSPSPIRTPTRAPGNRHDSPRPAFVSASAGQGPPEIPVGEIACVAVQMPDLDHGATLAAIALAR